MPPRPVSVERAPSPGGPARRTPARAVLAVLVLAMLVQGCTLRVGEVDVPESWRDNYRGGRIDPPAGR